MMIVSIFMPNTWLSYNFN